MMIKKLALLHNFYKKTRSRLLWILFYIPVTRVWAERRLPQHTKGYKYYWENAISKKYRDDMYHRQKCMDANPTFKKMRDIIHKHKPQTVLNVGCGYGRELKALSPFFNIEGCDIAEDLLTKNNECSRIFKFDIVENTSDKKWDVLFCRAVMMYLTNSEIMGKAMKNMESMTTKKVIVWEWPHICQSMRKTYPSAKFEYHPISYREDE